MKKYSIQDLWIRVILFFVICVILIFTFQTFIIPLVRQLFNNGNPFPEALETNLIRAMNGIVGIGLVYVFLQFDRQKMETVGFSWNKKMALEWILLSIPITIVGLIPTVFIELSFEILPTELELVDPIAIIFNFSAAMFAIALGEEILFRGYIQSILETEYSFVVAAIVSAGLFGLLHLLLLARFGRFEDMIAILFSAFFIGLTFSYVFKTTRYNLILPVAIHGFWDTFYFIFQAETTYETFFHTLMGIVASIIGAMVIFILIYLYSTKRLTKIMIE